MHSRPGKKKEMLSRRISAPGTAPLGKERGGVSGVVLERLDDNGLFIGSRS
jgi:hypothetical protein